MTDQSAYRDFVARFKLLIGKHPNLITTTLSNIFTMRLIGNKTHGDLAEIAIAEFINQYMYDFRSLHVGKDLYRAKSHEEDITVTNEITHVEFPVSLKAYGDGPLQLSTDKECRMFARLLEAGSVVGRDMVEPLLGEACFTDFHETNVMPLIYNESAQQCNILIFNYEKALSETEKILLVQEGAGRKHPVFRFMTKLDQYICEVRYGDAKANALQRGLWTNTKNALPFFESATNGWIDYSHNTVLVQLFSHALVGSSAGHAEALEVIKRDIDRLRNESGLK